MNYGLRYSIALVIGAILAVIWIWLFTPDPPFFSFMPKSYSPATKKAEIIAYFVQSKFFFYLPHFIVLYFYLRKKRKVNKVWDEISKHSHKNLIREGQKEISLFKKQLKEDGSWDEMKKFIKRYRVVLIIVLIVACPIIIVIIFWLLKVVFAIFNFFYSTPAGSEIFWTYTKTLAIPILLLLLPPAYVRLKEEISTHPRFRRWFSFSRGGSARWAGIRNYRKHLFLDFNEKQERYGYRVPAIYFGKTLFEDTFKSKHIALEDDGHLLTVGCTGSGKSATALWTNLAMYQGSMLIIDPKGEHAKKTFWRRSAEHYRPDNETSSSAKTKLYFHNNCYSFLLDPFNHVSELPSVRYNPLSDINIESDHARKLLSYISDACVLPEGTKNQHFVDTASLLLEGVIAHVLSKFPKENHNLPFVCDLLIGLDSEIGVADPEVFNNLLIEMRMNSVAGGIAQIAASRLDEMGANERGSVLSTLARSVKWITDPAMRKHLSESNFSLKILKKEQSDKYQFNAAYTIYVVLPFDYMETQARWLRTITNISLGLIQTAPKPPSPPTLFVLDEFPMMGGKLRRIEEGIVTLRGAGVKLWILVQNIGQLKRDYDKNWETFVSSSTVQLFGVKDLDTAQWASAMLGNLMSIRTEKTGWVKKRVVSENARELATPPEIMEELGKASPTQYVFPMTGLPMRLHRLAYKPLAIDGNDFKGLPLKGHFEE